MRSFVQKFNVFVNIADVNSASTSSPTLKSETTPWFCMDATQKFEKKYQLKNTYSLPSRVSKQEDGTPRQSKSRLAVDRKRSG